MAYTTLSPLDICNVALSKIGAQAINSLIDGTNASSLVCNNNFNLAYLEVARAARWNCLMTVATLAAVPQTPVTGTPPPITATPWTPNTNYAANVYVTFGGYYYQVMFPYTSSISFLNDLTTGALTQTDQQTASTNFLGTTSGSSFPSGWPFAYQLPADFELLGAVNNNLIDNFGAGSWYGVNTSDFQIMGTTLYCNDSTCTIQYVSNQPDSTQWDSLFVNCVTLKLASAISTALRQDGGVMEAKLIEGYEMALRQARRVTGGEQQPRRFNPIASSNFNKARYGGGNG